MSLEKYHFILELYSTYWNTKPIVEVLINNESKVKLEIDGSKETPNIIKFSHICESQHRYNLSILRSNKSDTQTVIENNTTVKDQILHIKSISIDHIDLDTLLYKGIYKPRYPQQWFQEQIDNNIVVPETIPKCLDLGHNGTWSFKFSAPFYDWWLLEWDQNNG